MNPFSQHCGPFNAVSKKRSRDPIDEVCRQHDIAYGKLQKVGKNPYFKYNTADEKAIEEWRNVGGPLGELYSNFFSLKKMFLPAEYENPPDLPDNDPLESNVPSLVLPKKVHFEKSSMARSRTRRYGKRRRSRSRKKTGYRKRRKVYRKKRPVKRRSRAYMAAYIKDLITPPQTLKIASGQVILPPVNSGRTTFFMAHVMHSPYIYQEIYNATGNTGSFMSTHLASESCITFASQIHHIKNHSDFPCVVTAYEFVPRYSYRDIDYAPKELRLRASNSIMQLIQASMHTMTDSLDDALIEFFESDMTGAEEFYAYVQAPDFVQPFNRTFTNVFKLIRRHKGRKLEAGEQTTYKMVSKRYTKMIHQIHTGTIGGHQPDVFAGRSRFILFKVQGTAVGNALDEKEVSSSSYQLLHNIYDTYTVKTISRNYPQKEWVENRPAIIPANEEMITNAQMEMDQAEQ